MIIVTAGAQEARLSRSFINHGLVLEAFLFREGRSRCIHRLLQEVQIDSIYSHVELFVFGGPLHRRPEIQLSWSHVGSGFLL